MTDPIQIYFATLALIVWIAHAIDDSEPTRSGDELPWSRRYDSEKLPDEQSSGEPFMTGAQ